MKAMSVKYFQNLLSINAKDINTVHDIKVKMLAGAANNEWGSVLGTQKGNSYSTHDILN